MVELSSLAGAGWQFFGNNGLPLAGGKLYTYAAGTTTPLATYTSISGATPHANPIIMDSAGRVPSEIWLTSAANYKFTLKTSADVEIWTKDNIPGIFTADSIIPASHVSFNGFNGQTGTVQDLAGNDGSDWIGFLQTGTGAVARSAQEKMRDTIGVDDFGADPTGVADSTTAFSAAIATVRDTMQPVPATAGATTWALPQDAIFLPGGTYKLSDVLALIAKSGYGATELSIWAIPGTVSVSIPAGKYAFETSITLLSLYIYGINFFGGKGVFKDSFTGVNVKGFLRLRDCVFDNYTECAIQHNASDMPYWRIENCSFMGADGQPTIGIAINGLADSSIISGNTFLRNKWHVKHRNVNSGSVYIQNNDFINWGGTTVREADIWFTGSTNNLFGVNAGTATLVVGNKFGNENSAFGKPRIMFAVEDTSVGTDNGSRNVNSTVWTTAAGGSPYVRSLQFKSNRISTINGAAGPGAPFMMSYLDKVSGILVDRDNAWDGGRWDYLVQFMDSGARVGTYDSNDWDVRISAYSGITGIGSPFKEISNYPIGPVRLSSVPMLGSHAQPEYSTLLGNETTLANCATQADWQLTGGATKASATGPDGVSGNAALITCAATTTQAYRTVVNVTGYEDRVCWISMALSQAAANSVTEVNVQLTNFSTNQIAFQDVVRLPAQWGNAPFCFSFELPASASPASWQLRIAPRDYSAGTKTDFLVGQLHINTGAAPLRRPLANFIADPTGGATVDTQARTAINAILDALISGNIMKAV